MGKDQPPDGDKLLGVATCLAALAFEVTAGRPEDETFAQQAVPLLLAICDPGAWESDVPNAALLRRPGDAEDAFNTAVHERVGAMSAAMTPPHKQPQQAQQKSDAPTATAVQGQSSAAPPDKQRALRWRHANALHLQEACRLAALALENLAGHEAARPGMVEVGVLPCMVPCLRCGDVELRCAAAGVLAAVSRPPKLQPDSSDKLAADIEGKHMRHAHTHTARDCMR